MQEFDVLADHPDYRMTFHRTKYRTEGITPKLVITFGGQPADLDHVGFGTKWALSSGWDTIYVTQRFGTQYQGLSLDAFFSAVSDHCSGRDVVCYGSSLGAYAALYYGGAIDARMIAGAPMLPAWPPLGQKKYADIAITHGDLKDGPLSPHDPVVIFDPMTPNDKTVVEQMVTPAYPKLRRIEVPFGGHTVLITLDKAGIVSRLIRTIIDTGEIMDFTVPGEGTEVYHAERARYLVRQGLKDLARVELEKSIQIAPSPRNVGTLIKLYIRMKELGAAQDLITRCVESGDRNMRIIAPVVEAARDAGLYVPEAA